MGHGLPHGRKGEAAALQPGKQRFRPAGAGQDFAAHKALRRQARSLRKPRRGAGHGRKRRIHDKKALISVVHGCGRDGGGGEGDAGRFAQQQVADEHGGAKRADERARRVVPHPGDGQHEEPPCAASRCGGDARLQKAQQLRILGHGFGGSVAQGAQQQHTALPARKRRKAQRAAHSLSGILRGGNAGRGDEQQGVFQG